MYPYRERDGPDEFGSSPVRTSSLRDSLAALAERVREQIAGAVGVAVADAVQQAVKGFLDRAQTPPRRRTSAWERDAADDEGDWDDGADRRPLPAETRPSPDGRLTRLTAAVAAGVQAIRWCQRRTTGGGFWLPVGVGVVVSVVILAVHPLAVLTSAAFAVLALTDGAAAAGRVLTAVFGC